MTHTLYYVKEERSFYKVDLDLSNEQIAQLKSGKMSIHTLADLISESPDEVENGLDYSGVDTMAEITVEDPETMDSFNVKPLKKIVPI